MAARMLEDTLGWAPVREKLGLCRPRPKSGRPCWGVDGRPGQTSFLGDGGRARLAGAAPGPDEAGGRRQHHRQQVPPAEQCLSLTGHEELGAAPRALQAPRSQMPSWDRRWDGSCAIWGTEPLPERRRKGTERLSFSKWTVPCSRCGCVRACVWGVRSRWQLSSTGHLRAPRSTWELLAADRPSPDAHREPVDRGARGLDCHYNCVLG